MTPNQLIRPDTFGWFDDETDTNPAHDPGHAGICAVCSKPTREHSSENPLVTVSLAVQSHEFRHRSYFFRTHKPCWTNISEDEQNAIESSLIDTIHGKDQH